MTRNIPQNLILTFKISSPIIKSDYIINKLQNLIPKKKEIKCSAKYVVYLTHYSIPYQIAHISFVWTVVLIIFQPKLNSSLIYYVLIILVSSHLPNLHKYGIFSHRKFSKILQNVKNSPIYRLTPI